MKSLVVVPTYNEADNLRELVPRVLEQDPGMELLVVDDNSPDGTGDLVELLRKTEPRLHVLHRERKMGLGTAYVAGFRYALERDYDLVFEMDADFSHDPDSLPASDTEITHINLNDQTLEGFRSRKDPMFCVQYHPEAAPGPHDSRYLFDQFVTLMDNA